MTDQAELVAVASRTEHKDAGITALERAVESIASDAERRELLDGIAGAREKQVGRQACASVSSRKWTTPRLARKAALRSSGRSAWRSSSRESKRLRPRQARPTRMPQLDEAAPTVAGARRRTRMRSATQQFATKLAAARAAIEARRREEAETVGRSRARRGAPRGIRRALRARRRAARRRHARRTRKSARRVGRHARRVGPGARRRRAAGAVRRIVPARVRASREPPGARKDSHPARRALARGRPRSRSLDEHAPRAPSATPRGAPSPTSGRHSPAQADGLDEAIASRFAEAVSRVQHREDEKRAAAERTLKQQVQRVEQLLERVTARAAAEDLTLREADRAVRDLKSAIDAPPHVPAREQHALARASQGRR